MRLLGGGQPDDSRYVLSRQALRRTGNVVDHALLVDSKQAAPEVVAADHANHVRRRRGLLRPWHGEQASQFLLENRPPGGGRELDRPDLVDGDRPVATIGESHLDLSLVGSDDGTPKRFAGAEVERRRPTPRVAGERNLQGDRTIEGVFGRSACQVVASRRVADEEHVLGNPRVAPDPQPHRRTNRPAEEGANRIGLQRPGLDRPAPVTLGDRVDPVTDPQSPVSGRRPVDLQVGHGPPSAAPLTGWHHAQAADRVEAAVGDPHRWAAACKTHRADCPERLPAEAPLAGRQAAEHPVTARHQKAHAARQAVKAWLGPGRCLPAASRAIARAGPGDRVGMKLDGAGEQRRVDDHRRGGGVRGGGKAAG